MTHRGGLRECLKIRSRRKAGVFLAKKQSFRLVESRFNSPYILFFRSKIHPASPVRLFANAPKDETFDP
jgi:hypothetical protein